MKTLMIFFSIMLAVSGCENPENSQQVDRQELDRQLEEIKDLIAKEACDGVNSCDYIAVGSKAYGGPKNLFALLFLNRQAKLAGFSGKL